MSRVVDPGEDDPGQDPTVNNRTGSVSDPRKATHIRVRPHKMYTIKKTGSVTVPISPLQFLHRGE